MADLKSNNLNINASNAKQISPLKGISTEDQDLSTGHGGSKFQSSLMENNLAGGSRALDTSLMDNGSQDFLNSHQQSTIVAYNHAQSTSRRNDGGDKTLNSVDELDHKGSMNKVMTRGHNSVGDAAFRIKKGKKQVRVAYQMAKHTIDRIIYPVQTKRGLKYPKRRPSNDGG